MRAQLLPKAGPIVAVSLLARELESVDAVKADIERRVAVATSPFECVPLQHSEVDGEPREKAVRAAQQRLPRSRSRPF